MNVTLTFKMKPARSATLIMGELEIRGMGPYRITYEATSGIAGCQSPRHYWTRGKGLLPPSVAITSKYMVETKPVRPTNPQAAGEWQFRILPDEVWNDRSETNEGHGPTGESFRRTLLRIHYDANHATSPGSAGCIVIVDKEQWDAFQQDMESIEEAVVPLTVEYL